MKIKTAKLEWYALKIDMNTRKIEKCNVFGHDFVEDLHKSIQKKKVSNYSELKEFIKRYLMYHYWCKTEYEMAVGYMSSNIKQEDLYKVDVYSQLEINLDRIVEYVNAELKINFSKGDK